MKTTNNASESDLDPKKRPPLPPFPPPTSSAVGAETDSFFNSLRIHSKRWTTMMTQLDSVTTDALILMSPASLEVTSLSESLVSAAGVANKFACGRKDVYLVMPKKNDNDDVISINYLLF